MLLCTLSIRFSPPIHWVSPRLDCAIPTPDFDSDIVSSRLSFFALVSLESNSRPSLTLFTALARLTTRSIRLYSTYRSICSSPSPSHTHTHSLSHPLPLDSPRARSVGLFAPSDHAHTKCRSMNGRPANTCSHKNF